MRLRRTAALTVLLFGVSTVALLGAGSAEAHVTVAAPGVVAGASDAVINFHVPNESAAASTVGLKLQLPTDTPIAGVLVSPMPGWTATIVQTKLTNPIKTDDGDITEVVSEIDWTADAGAGIKPGYFGQFTIIAGKLPDDVSSLVFKAVQTYSDKSVVSWIETAAPGSTAEPDHPAPTLTLATTGSTTPAASSSASPAATTAAASASGGSSDTTATVLAIVAIVLAALALAAVLLRGRSAPRA